MVVKKMEHEEAIDRTVGERSKLGYRRIVEIPDPVPMEPPLGYRRQPSLMEQVREMVRSEQLRREVESAGMETFEESEDFDVEDYDPRSPWEENFDPVEELRERRLYEQSLRDEADRRDAEAAERLRPTLGREEAPQAPPRSKAPKKSKEEPSGDDAGDD